MLKKKRFLIGGIIVVLAIAFLGYTGFENSATYYYTVSELYTQEVPNSDQIIRVNGQVAANSIEKDIRERTLRFTIVDVEADKSLPIYYQGITPDNFGVGSDVVVEGHLDSAGILHASNILTKCPSKYEPEE
ncbi:cytochrome c maturation protein CcmE [Chloroflexota bacterium]